MACEIPKERGLPFSRLSRREIAREAAKRGIVASISGSTVWRWLSTDAIKPWFHRSWIWPRDPDFAAKGSRVLDLYQGVWESEPLDPSDYVICADEKTSIQARKRVAKGTGPAPGRARRVEFEYERKGALAYMAAWDVRQARVFGLCSSMSGIDAYHDLVDLVMSQEPYHSASRVFWITDNGSSHRGQTSRQRLSLWHPNAIQIHTPVHASWLNQVEIYFSIVQRKVLTPNEFEDLRELEDQLMAFQARYNQIAQPFQWKFTADDLGNMLDKLALHDAQTRQLVA